MHRIIPIGIIGLVLVFSILVFRGWRPELPSSEKEVAESTSAAPEAGQIGEALSHARSRITLKTFGLYVSPKVSPVQPERFTGYHTGTDFEVTAEEQNTIVPVYVVCAGPLQLKETAQGYGGVAVQQCQIKGETVTVIYGHIKLSSVSAGMGQELKKGEQLGVLGQGYTPETDGERKHLHLGIHKGDSINIKGYVSNKSDLKYWVNAGLLLP